MERNKLVIIRERSQGRSTSFDPTDDSTAFEVPFNPPDYALRDENEFAVLPVRGLNTPLLQYSRGGVRTLSLSLMLDTYASGPEEQRGTDVRVTHVRHLERLVEIDGDLHRPPLCKVLWGGLEFVGFVVSLDKRYTLFMNDGTPVRARVGLTLHEAAGAEVQAMETRMSSPDKTKKHTVQEGDTLWQIAYKEYGEPGLWRRIAETNGIDDPRRLATGFELLIPALPAERRR